MPCITPCRAARWPTTRGAFARSSSAASGFFFCGMIEDEDAHASRDLAEPELLRATTARSPCPAATGASRRSRRRPGSPGRSRGWRRRRSSSGRRPRSPSSLATSRRSVGKFTPASAPAPSGSSPVEPEHDREARGVAPEHPEVGQQVMREIDRLRALQVRVAGHRPVQVRLGDAHDHRLQVLQRLDRPQRVGAREHRHVGGDLVVARARRVELAADRADDLGQPPLDGHVDVLVGVEEPELVGVELGLDAIEPVEQLVAVGLGDDPHRGEHRRVGAGLLDVVGIEPPIEADRRVHPHENWVGGQREATHRPPSCTKDGLARPPSAPPGPVRPAALRVGEAVLHRLRGQ